jgi:hypothetical protein
MSQRAATIAVRACNAHTQVGEMATGMGFFQRFRSSVSNKAGLLEQLTILAGNNQGLVERMRWHAAICNYPNIKAGVVALAEKEARHVKALNAILSDHNVWAKTPEIPLHDGSNNWARLSGDLAMLGSLAAELRLASVKWESVDEAISNQLRQLANEDDEYEIELRKLAMKCDAMALD